MPQCVSITNEHSGHTVQAIHVICWQSASAWALQRAGKGNGMPSAAVYRFGVRTKTAEAKVVVERKVRSAVSVLRVKRQSGGCVNVGARSDIEVSDVGEPWMVVVARAHAIAELVACNRANPGAHLPAVRAKG